MDISVFFWYNLMNKMGVFSFLGSTVCNPLLFIYPFGYLANPWIFSVVVHIMFSIAASSV